MSAVPFRSTYWRVVVVVKNKVAPIRPLQGMQRQDILVQLEIRVGMNADKDEDGGRGGDEDGGGREGEVEDADGCCQERTPVGGDEKSKNLYLRGRIRMAEAAGKCLCVALGAF